MRRLFIAVLAAVTLLVPAAAHADASARVIATGLDNPRHLTFSGGVLYVAEAGSGGDGPCLIGPEGEVCYGASGAITAIKGDHQWRVAEGLPSIAAPDGSSAIGPIDIGRSGMKTLIATIGLGNDPAVAADGGVLGGLGFDTLAVVNTKTGAWRTVVDIGAWETANDPDGAGPDSNPYGLERWHGASYVADAGANALLEVRGRHVETVAVFPDTFVDAPPFLELPEGTQIPMQAVPTGVDRGPDGAFYVSTLTGFPFEPGAAAVWRVGDAGVPTLYAGGFTNLVDVAVGSDGSLYAVEISSTGLLSGDLTGALIKVAPDGTRTRCDGLFAPGGVAVRGKTAYVTTCSVCAGGGEVVAIRF